MPINRDGQRRSVTTRSAFGVAPTWNLGHRPGGVRNVGLRIAVRSGSLMAAMLVLASPGYATVVRAPSPPASSVPSSLRSRSTTVSPLRSGDAATQAWPLFFGPEVGVIAEEGTTTGCTTVYRTKDFSHWRDITPPQVAPPEGPQPRGGCLYIWQSRVLRVG